MGAHYESYESVLAAAAATSVVELPSTVFAGNYGDSTAHATSAAAATLDETSLPPTIAAGAVAAAAALLNVTYSVPYVSGVDVAVLRCSLEHVECAAARWIPVALAPPLLLLGTLGNVLCIWLLTSTGQARRKAFSMYIASIAAADTLALWTAVPRQFVRGCWLIDIRQIDKWLCRSQRLLRFGSLDASSWLLVAVTSERFVSTCFPTKAHYYRSTRRTRIVIASVVVVMFAWNSHVFWSLDVEYGPDGAVIRQCGYASPSAAVYWTRHHAWLSMLVYSILPCLAMLVMNAMIVVQLRRRQKQTVLRPVGSSAPILAGGGVRGDRETSVTSFTINNRVSTVMRKHGTVGGKTRMLLPVTLFFFVATVPHFVHAAFESLDRVSIHSRYQATVRMLDALATVMQFANNSMNFWIYCLAGKSYRRRLVELLRRRC